MKKYSYRGFYGDSGTLTEHNNGETVLRCFVNGKETHNRRYKNLKSAKSALYRMSDSFTLTEIK